MKEYMYKILVIGVDFALKIVQHSSHLIVRLQLWDIAGQERFGSMTRVYYKSALGALVVYDRTRPATFDGVIKWKKDIDEKVSLPDAWGGGRIPVILLANKSDLVSDIRLNRQEMDEFCSEHGFIRWFETSAKTNANIEEATKCLIDAILELEEIHGEPFIEDEEAIRLSDPKKNKKTSSESGVGGGCC
ncbi:Ras- protein Rab-38 [Apophysomyces ossiformis]|uniref:Ras- protein Rab-38 n=1 Tax=Apophysomyces ossiformis TaxID=679940 RepID=A0A8H7BKC5_9FUNG|nr:Ras- protein Rab-38 [Apophysomyces ossiformis]